MRTANRKRFIIKTRSGPFLSNRPLKSLYSSLYKYKQKKELVFAFRNSFHNPKEPKWQWNRADASLKKREKSPHTVYHCEAKRPSDERHAWRIDYCLHWHLNWRICAMGDAKWNRNKRAKKKRNMYNKRNGLLGLINMFCFFFPYKLSRFYFVNFLENYKRKREKRLIYYLYVVI